MRASCERGHNRVDMVYRQAELYWQCPACGEVVTPEAIDYATPAAYRQSDSVLGATLRAMADYDIEGVVGEGGRLKIEYPRPSHDRRPS